MKSLLTLLIVLINLNVSLQTLSKENKKKSKGIETIKKIKTSIKSVSERELVKETLDVKEIINNHEIYCNGKSCKGKFFHNYVLGYVTPWNTHGYNVTELFAHKFTHIAPVWYQMRPECKIKEDNYDGEWIKRVKNKNKKIKIVPRIVFEGWTLKDYKALFTSESTMEDCIFVFDNLIKNKNYDGVVLEIWNPETLKMKEDLMHFLKHLSQRLHSVKKVLILVIPPPFYNDVRELGMFVREDYDKLKDHIDGFSLMTYDWAMHNQVIGPNSPSEWTKKCVSYLADEDDPVGRYKIFMGLNFYGKDYELPSSQEEPITTPPEDVVGTSYVERLQKYVPTCEWNKDWEESLCRYRRDGKSRVLLYPTLASIERRLDMADQLNVGVSIWEVGQGLDYFYDLF